jgi:hypothetical protein
MPLVVNRHGIVSCVRDEHLADAVASQGCRQLDEADWNYASDNVRDHFRVPTVDGYAQGCLGSRCVVVAGAGPSHAAHVAGAFRVAVNPRAGSPAMDVALALDDVYWYGSHWAAVQAAHPGARPFYPKGGAGPHDSVNATRFTLPIYPVKQRAWRTVALRVEDAMVHAHFSSVAGLLVAKYLTSGPVILTGVDLSGDDDAGESYATRQAWVWERVAQVVDGVFVHASLTGPLADYFPRWTDGDRT